MIEQKIPLFASGNLLTQEMLDCIKEYPINASRLNLCGYSDGILCGCEIMTSDRCITVGKGILILEETPFFITEPVTIQYGNTNQPVVLRAVIGEKEVSDYFVTRQMTVELAALEKLREGDIELCRFRLQKGALLRTQYESLQDMETEYDTIQLLYAKWAAQEKSSIAPPVLRQFAKEAMKLHANDVDAAMCLQILNLNGRSMQRDALQFYIARRLEHPFKELTNAEIHRGLCEILQKIKRPGQSISERQRRPSRILVD